MRSYPLSWHSSASWAKGLATLALLACAPGPGSDPGDATPTLTAPSGSVERSAPIGPEATGPSDFSADRAWAHLESILAGGPRPAGSSAADTARSYLENRLAASGLQLEQVAFELAPPPGRDVPRHVTSLLATLDGASDDLLIVAAPYTSPERAGAAIPGANEGGSGAAVALELARAVAEKERPYSYLFAFIAGDGGEQDPVAGSRELARELAQRGLFERARAGLFLDRVGDAELRVARDLNSSGPYRDIVWQSAHARGYAEVFPTDGFDAPEGGHRVLGEAGLHQVVALIDPSHGGDVPPGAHARTEADDLANCAPESLGIVGAVALDALRAIETRLVRIDRYASAPADATRTNERDREAASVTTPLVDAVPASDGTGDSP